MSNVQKLKALIAQPEIIIAGGVYDGLSAMLVQEAGLSCAYMTGFGTAASILGAPDYGLLTMTEMVNHTKNLSNCLSIPMIADADTGYGNPLNVRRTVMEYEGAGAAAIQLEDQAFPKRCGHMEGKVVIPMLEHCKKIEMAAKTRKEALIIARTDARAPLGLDEAIKRAKAYVEAGADIIFVDAPQSTDELKTIAQNIKAPLMVNMTEGGKTPILTGEQLQEIGFKIAIYPCITVFAAAKAMKEVLADLKREGTSVNILDKLDNFHDFNKSVGLPFYHSLESKYVHSDA
ncbi:MAG: carboxyvinyl-carboxyphosphonate phosphorylmutase [Firmicutes bacterium HGW-Firmicutes-12]|jgi:methylisocitrate lyase|nr:MAG: carboxyvinyl-carboxyphosphonate phosphorylmutase [Firmicutes bacterium HGW-Firmicutes-12]